MKVAAYILTGNGHAALTCPAMVAGARAQGETVDILSEKQYKKDHADTYDAAIFWGYVEIMQTIMNDFNAREKPVVYLDLAYWERGTHYKVSIGARHPTKYFQNFPHNDSRLQRWGVKLESKWVDDGTILLVGMGPKAAWAEKQEPVESWEKNAIANLKRCTDRPIIYRPKPSQHYGKPIAGTTFDVTTPLEKALRSSWATVTHHSNVAVEGVVLGVPTFAWSGVAVPMGLQDFGCIEVPYRPDIDTVQEWLNDVSYCQWSMDEMKDGTCWRHLRSEGLV